MELETELEEGEACFQNKFEEDSTIDPDISLSYLDERIQDVLGDCRKDFEGGFSAENLGSKFGGYGSFLPTYQRSPVWPHPKTPPKVLTYSAPVSPNNAHIEVAHQNSVTQSSAPLPARNGPSANGNLKQEEPKSRGEKSTLTGQRSLNNFANDSDHNKSLKVRIKVGSENLSTRKNAEIYSGLGLDVSPSSSLEASPQDGPNESPTSILEIMTSFPVCGSFLLSPLPYDVLHLTENEKREDSSCGPLLKGSQESSVTALHGSDLGKIDQNVLGEKPNSSDKNSASMESTNGDDVHIGIGVLTKKDTSMNNSALGNKTSSSGGKRKSKGQILDNDSRNIDISKSGLKIDSITSSRMNNAHGSKSYAEDIKKNSGKVRETYKDFFGELDLEQEDHDEIMALEKPFEGNNGKRTLEDNGLSKVRLNGNKSQKPSSQVPTTSNGPVSDVAATTVAPVVNDNWVCCDKCEKWRLLPPGVNPGSLPEKWLCSMLDWLPGMNRCSISEEETIKAITSRVPGPSVQGSQPVHPGGPQLGMIFLDASHPDGTHQHFDSQIPSIGIKKKHGSKDLANEAKRDRPSLSSNSVKNLHTSYRSISLNGANQSPPVNEVDFQDSGQSRHMIAEKNRLKQKENKKLWENFVDEGNNINQSKISNKRESIQDFPKDFKKVKTDGNDGALNMGKCDNRDVGKKRKKPNEIEGTGKYVKETSETNRRKEKKARVLISGDEICGSKGKNVEDAQIRSLAATSSSSKVSGSHRTKANNQEAKGSPVESVSSSPLRILNLDKFTSPRRNIRGIEPLNKNADIRRYEEKSKGGRNKSKGKPYVDSKALPSSENAKTHGQSKHRHHDGSKRDVSKKGKSHSLPPSGKGQNETRLPGYQKENVGNTMSIDTAKHSDSLKGSKPNKTAQNENGNQPMKHKGRDEGAPIHIVRDISNQATTNALREATNLKHMADRLKNNGSSLESRALYMQAALKFLHVASLFESCHSQTGRYGDMIQSKSIYSSTAKLCEYCAHEYERTKEMPTAALAYKCMEVAYMKVIYSSHATASKDVNELQTSLQIGPTGESPSSSASASASDLDNLNNPVTIDKAALSKGVSAPQVPGNHVIPPRNKPNFTRILNFAQDVNSAMEASGRSCIAFTAFSSKEEAGLSAVKKALDFHFHDVGELLHLVRVAMEVINR